MPPPPWAQRHPAARALGLLVAGLTACTCGARPAGGLATGLFEISRADGGAWAPDAGADAGADAGTAFTDDGGCACAAWGPSASAGLLADPELVELSGLAASRAHPGVLWAHNDSGDSARFFGLSDQGATLGRFTLPGAVARDIEDLALGPCPLGTCVYLGDIGDNLAVRDDTAVFRVAEPQPRPDAGTGSFPVSFERFDFAYPNGRHHNAEALLVHPVTGDVYVLTKQGPGTRSRVYRFPRPLDASAEAVLEDLGEASVPASGDLHLTGGDVSPCGNALLLRMYNRVVELRLPPGRPFEAIFQAAPRALPTASEPQGEAVAWSHDGRAYFTASEGAAQALHRFDCP